MEQLEQARLRANLIKLFFYAFFMTFLVIIPVIVPFWQEKGLTLQQIFTLQGIFGGILIVLDAPAGYIADLFGRKRTMILGSIVSALGFQLLWVGESFFDFVIYEAVLAVGLSLQSGCDVAILYTTLEKLGEKGRTAAFLGRRVTANTVGEGVASLLGGILAAYSLSWPAYVNAFTPWLCVLFACLVYEPEEVKMARSSHIQNIKAIGKALFAHSRLLRWVIINFIFYGFATYCAVWSFQPYWKEQGFSVAMFGYLWAANSFIVAIVARHAHRIEERMGSSWSVFLIALLPVIGYLGMGLSGGVLGLLFSLAFPLCRGMNQVLFQDAINTRVPPEMRATVNSIGSLGMRALFLAFGPMLGHVLDTRGPKEAMILMGVVYLIGFFAVAAPLLGQRREFRVL